ncbi:hypothetical protein MB46_00580 [Arthrobacter alpinus]|uniref:YciE/YciF ferroxidase family protein n=1 Tax=Arthrobacter alpinus TaxID=656366 RepID=UPI000679E61F|nr:DUF892 family protein [Arthrobacter alpinus]ALV44232.1 hypothetical protein MB46_00580 [Arthrobacter alpinus]
MFEHFNTAEEIFRYKLGLALTMEHDSQELLHDMRKAAMRSEVKELFQEHTHETRQQIENLHQCFALLSTEAGQSPSPTTKGLAKELKSLLGKVDSSLADGVVLSGAIETEHYEVAVYETLILQAKARGVAGVAELLNQNLLQEKSMIGKLLTATETIAREDAAAQADTAASPAPEIEVPPYLPPGSI